MKPLTYLSVCSGIEAASVAWHPLGWHAAGYSEIEPFPCAVLHQHYSTGRPQFMPDPDAAGLSSKDRQARRAAIKAVAMLPESANGIPNFGDMTRFKEWPDANVDVLVGGTPCQSFSVAGLRKGLADPRGNLALVYLAIANRYRPEWILWENVPGVLSSSEGRDFGAFIGGLAELGYHAAWRVLDAQYVRVDGFGRAVPQRRRRVFVVGHSRDWRRAAAVLFERESLRGNPAPRRETGKGVAPTISARPTGGGGLGTDFDLDGGLIPSTGDVPHCLNAGGMGRQDYETETVIAVAPPVAASLTRGAESAGKGGYAGRRQEDDSNIIAIQERAVCENAANGPDGIGVRADGAAYTLEARTVPQAVAMDWAVRRLMPIECERLQGFPDGYTDVPYRGKPAVGGPRYKALGNSMAVNCMRWIGQRIDLVRRITEE